MQLTPEQVKGRIKNVAKENKADARSGESFMLEEFVTEKKAYKFGTTDLEFSLCICRFIIACV